jgi:hypothetical protein
LADEIAADDGATAPRRVDPHPDHIALVGPPLCDDCHAPVRHLATNYDKWVYLSVLDVRAKDVPRRYRWRLEPIRARHSAFIVDMIAVKISGIEPLPSDLITPAHRAVCTSPDAVREVEEARLADLLRGQRHEHEYDEEDVPDEPVF